MRYVLGLDLGIASIGWAIYNMDNPNIEKCGVRLFEPGSKGARNNASASFISFKAPRARKCAAGFVDALIVCKRLKNI